MVRLAPRDELAAAARVAPLLRTARDLARWAAAHPGPPAGADSAAADLGLTPEEAQAAWLVATGAGLIGQPDSAQRAEILAGGDPDAVLALWTDALSATLCATELDGLVTALYTAGGPVRIDALFEAYQIAREQAPAEEPKAGEAGAGLPGGAGAGLPGGAEAGLPGGIETLADLGVVDLGTDEDAGGLTVTLSRLGIWGAHGRLRARGWQLPVAGQLAHDRAAVLLAALAEYDAEEGEAEIAAWLARRAAGEAATELMDAARQGSPGLRGAAFAVLDRVGDEAVPAVRQTLDDPVLRPHAVVWLRDHGEQAELSRGDQEWLLVDLGAGLLEEAQPEDVVAELLPDLPPGGQAKLVAGLWQVDHPGLIGLLTALAEHHHDPAVAKAARKAALKARSPQAAPPGAG